MPFVWFGTLALFGGLAIMPFALILLSGETPTSLGRPRRCGAGLRAAGAGLQTTQTAGLALASDLAPEATRPRVVALLYVMLLIGMVGASLVFGVLLADYSHTRLVQVVQGTAIVSVSAQRRRDVEAGAAQQPARQAATSARKVLSALAALRVRAQVTRFLFAVGLGTAAFNMQDVILEPYGGEILKLASARRRSSPR